MLQPTGGADICNFSLNDVGIGLVNGQVCAKKFPFIAPMVACMLEFGADSI